MAGAHPHLTVSLINLLGGTVVVNIGWFCFGIGPVLYWSPRVLFASTGWFVAGFFGYRLR